MKKTTLLNLMIAFISLLFIAEIQAQNLIVNGDFEEGEVEDPVPLPWEGFNNRILNDNITGDRVGQVENGEGALRQDVEVEPGETYEVSFEYRWVDAGNQENSNMVVRFRNPDVGGPDGNLDLADGSNGFQLESTLDEWFTGTFNVTIPDGLTEARLQFFKGPPNKPINFKNVVVQLEGTASVQNLEMFDFQMYPNPVQTQFNVSANEIISKIEIYNVTGKKIDEILINARQSQISTEHLSQGVYLVKTFIGKNVGTSKLIKQ